MKNSQTVAAIVPAYNESENITRVLDVLVKTEIIDEIIVVDDGSSDNTCEVVSQYGEVKLLLNGTNHGKAYSMQKGVDHAKAEIIFFCDADLRDFSPEIATAIIDPVLQGDYDMYIGIRNNVMQKVVKLFAINSGERAMTRSIWEQVPAEYKQGFRIEAGLNHVASLEGNRWGYKKFSYYQTLKEKKYGFIKGTLLRWKMNADVSAAYGLNALDKSHEIKDKASEKTHDLTDKVKDVTDKVLHR